MSRTRESIQAQLLEYLYGELSPEERAELEEGLLQYPDLQAELQEMTRTREAWRDVPEALPVSHAVRETVLAEARRVAEERRESTPTSWERFLAGWNQPAFASALALVLVGGVGLYVADSIHNSATDAAVLRATSLASEVSECSGGYAEPGGG